MTDLRAALAATTDEEIVDLAALPTALEVEGARPVLMENIDD